MAKREFAHDILIQAERHQEQHRDARFRNNAAVCKELRGIVNENATLSKSQADNLYRLVNRLGWSLAGSFELDMEVIQLATYINSCRQ